MDAQSNFGRQPGETGEGRLQIEGEVCIGEGRAGEGGEGSLPCLLRVACPSSCRKSMAVHARIDTVTDLLTFISNSCCVCELSTQERCQSMLTLAKIARVLQADG